MAHLKAAAMLLVALPASVGGNAAIQVQAVADFKRLCIDTHANPKIAFAAADAARWEKAPSDFPGFSDLAGSVDGRVIDLGTSDFRVFSAGENDNGSGALRKCALFAEETFEPAATRLTQTIAARPSAQTNDTLTWKNLVYVNGRWSSLDHMSGQQVVRLSQAPIVQITLARSGNGITLFFSEQSFGSAARQ